MVLELRLRQHRAADRPRKRDELHRPSFGLDEMGTHSAGDEHAGHFEGTENVDAGSAPRRAGDVVVPSDDDDLDPGRRQPKDPPGEFALMRGRRIARLVNIAGEHHQVHVGLDRPINRLIERAKKIVQPLVEPRLRIDPPVVLHPNVRIREMRDF